MEGTYGLNTFTERNKVLLFPFARMIFVDLQMKEMGLPLGFLNVSPYELDENSGQVKPVIDPKRGKRKSRKKKKKQVLEEDVVKVIFFYLL